MSLDTYAKKRDFKKTAEPRGSPARKGRARGDSFVIQKHAARRLHYDFRLEMEGVLKSWAVTRGPSLVPGEKRLAVHVEDHPLEYGGFEGTIPQGEYGGGSVILWDRGRWKPIGDLAKAYAKGHLEFELEGEKLQGRWHLVKMRGKPREKRENWLLIKGEDEAARSEDDPDILEELPHSVLSGRLVEELEGEAPGWSSKSGPIEGPAKPAGKTPAKKTPAKKTPAKTAPRKQAAKPTEVDEAAQPTLKGSKLKGAKPAALPAFVEPALATLVAKAPSGQRWIHEIKFDGYRIQARLDAGRVKLLTRRGHDWTKRFGKDLVAALRALPASAALLDGEIVVENDAGASDFSALQDDLARGRSDRFVFYLFDLLHLDGLDLSDTPLLQRKEALRGLLDPEGALLRFSEHFDENGDLVLRHACRLSLEGLVSKQRDGRYRSGRGKDWQKSKCSQREEFVVGGYVPSSTSRKAIGSLVLGQFEEGKLQHAGRVGTGFSAAVAASLHGQLEKLRVQKSPFAGRLGAEAARNVRYVSPRLVAEVEFRGWTADANLRHAAFRGLREDKDATDVVRESTAVPAARQAPRKVKLTHADRIYWPDAGVTKEGLADYYAELWPKIAPFIAGRLLALVRCPSGIEGQCFFQKHAWKGAGRELRRVHDPKDDSGEPMLAIDDLDGLFALVQGGVLEIHPWGSQIATLEQPDTIVIDLDPGEGVAWPEIVEAALEVRERLSAAGLAGFVRTSGGKGLHVVAPLVPKAGWDEVKGFTKALADTMASDAPDRFVSTVTKSKRRGKILVDYLRNGRGATAVASYSTRSRPGAPVAMPLGWDELGSVPGANYFRVDNALGRLAALAADPWADFRKSAAPLPAAARKGRSKAKPKT